MSNSFPSVVLAGLESVGKSALFRGLTGEAVGDEANVRGSTVLCRRCRIPGCDCDVVDVPGIRLREDAVTTQLALTSMAAADVVLMVARGTHVVTEVETLLRELDLRGKRSALVMTFRDKAVAEVEQVAEMYRERLGVPVVMVNARELDAEGRQQVIAAIEQAVELKWGGGESSAAAGAMALEVVEPEVTWFERRWLGAWLAAGCLLLMFGLPVYLAYGLAEGLQPVLEWVVIEPLTLVVSGWPEWVRVFLVGNYGLLTLGWYSFLWAFPVVLLVGVSVAVVEETGLKDRMTAALDPVLRRVGLSGRDLIPVLSGFGCNVVAVFQSRGCSACTRKSCVSMIAFGSACSYQIGATLSVMGAAGVPGLFLPYLVLLFLAGVLHTRLWYGGLAADGALPLSERAFLQWPSRRAVGWRVRSMLKQFLWQAMPVFLGICVVAAMLEWVGVLEPVSSWMGQGLAWLRLPPEVSPAILFSILRKDGLLVLNAEGGGLVAALSTGQLLLVIWLASTLTACLVTLWTIRRELGLGFALMTAGRQAVSSVLVAVVLALMI